MSTGIDIQANVTGDNELALAFKNIAKELENDAAVIREVLKPPAKIIVKSMRTAAKPMGKDFVVYRTPKKKKGMRAPNSMGKIYATIKSGTLARSIGIFQTKISKRWPSVYIGPRYKKGVWTDPEKGGWFLNMVQYGTPFVKPNPFIMKGFNAGKSAAKSLLLKLMKKKVKKIVTKAGKNKMVLQ
tara:strand:- start:77 stop:631 length:555 start_codon:yes stop_codon:yes gene_type:complete